MRERVLDKRQVRVRGEETEGERYRVRERQSERHLEKQRERNTGERGNI